MQTLAPKSSSVEPRRGMPQLPPELITEILSRLPPKSLLRLRCMSKSSQSEIDSPEFAELHLHRSLKSGSHQILRFKSTGEAQLFESLLDISNKPAVDETLAVNLNPYSFELCGSCHGLIAFSFKGGVLVWNPNIRKHWFPPLPDIVYGSGEDTPKTTFGLGYDSLSKDYKLVRIVRFSMFSYQIRDYQVMIYSFKSNSWTPSCNTPYPLKLCFERRYGVFAYNALHFVAASDSGSENSFFITALNLQTKKFRNLVEVPRRKTSPSGSSLHLMVLGGQLCVAFKMCDTEMIEAWVMKDYGGEEESWTKLLNISWRAFEHFVLLDYSESEKNLLLHYNWSGFVWINLETNAEDEQEEQVPQIPWETATLLVGSIVSVCGGVDSSIAFQERNELTDEEGNLHIIRFGDGLGGP